MGDIIFDYSDAIKYKMPRALSTLEPFEICHYCNRKTQLVFNKRYSDDYAEIMHLYNGGITEGDIHIYSCDCGWWSGFHQYRIIEDTSMMFYDGPVLQARFAKLREFEPTDVDLPMFELINYLKRKPEIVRDINPTKMEMLVGDILGKALDCRVEHCGRTGDGGVDLFVFEGDEPLLVQVKKREKPSTESVRTIREMLGSTLLKKGSKAAVVTTAEKFSANAIVTANEAISLGLLEKFELIDFNRFHKILQTTHSDNMLPWEVHSVDSLELVDKFRLNQWPKP